MDIYEIFYIFIGGLFIGLCPALFWDYLEKRVILRKTKTEGEHIFQEAQEKADILFEKHQKEFNSIQEKKLSIFEKEKENLSSFLQELQSKIDRAIHQLNLKNKEKELASTKIKKSVHQIRQMETNNWKQKRQLNSELKKYANNKVQKLENLFSIDLKELKRKLKKEIEEVWIDKIRKELEKRDKQNKQNLQKDSFFYLNMILNRFDRIYCSERGIGAVSFKTNEQLEKVIGSNNIYLNEIEKECGVDILINEEDRQASIFGIDPVRRELGRMTLKKLSKQNKVDTLIIQKIVKHSKKDLFAKIHQDGQSICRRLRLKNVAPEVQNMMGALRYRYSFAQNQYFHCEEVGWLCGLLNAELNLPIKPAHRAGMFHDIGKAMDHSIEGNHAVIGAEFLSKYKEKENILHPVRAHHHDETPSTPLAYLVIVADSISGSRPGARRFTEDSYNQKMANLERIIDSFENIEDAYIMSAGREMRVVVDNKKVSDKEALDLSQLIARKIEKECSYPGLIKVTVVRHSEKVAMA